MSPNRTVLGQLGVKVDSGSTLQSAAERELAATQRVRPPRSLFTARLAASRFPVWALLLFLTAAAFLLHGYHPFVEDSAFYIPAAEQALDASLFPHDAEFFQSHGALTGFPQLMAASTRLLHLPLEKVLLLWHLATLYLFLLGCWQVSCACFDRPEARYASIALVAALLTLQAGSTTLLIMDQYVNPRSLSTCAGVFAVALALKRRYLPGILLLCAAAFIHPLMSFYSAIFLVLLWWHQRKPGAVALAALLPFVTLLAPPTRAYHQAAMLHWWLFIRFWDWKRWLGLLGPVVLLAGFSRVARRRRMPNVALLCRSLLALILISFLGALVLNTFTRFETLSRVQPMRTLHLAYVFTLLLIGGMLGQFVLRRAPARWLLLFAPLCAGVAGVQMWAYPASPHIEWPGTESRNQWVRAFQWVRENTPRDAYFALDPAYLELPGEDRQAFRPIAERSVLADTIKDSGAVFMFPALAEKWWEQMNASKGWKHFQGADFRRLKERYEVNWVVVQPPAATGLDCPYRNGSVLVCRLK